MDLTASVNCFRPSQNVALHFPVISDIFEILTHLCTLGVFLCVCKTIWQSTPHKLAYCLQHHFKVCSTIRRFLSATRLIQTFDFLKEGVVWNKVIKEGNGRGIVAQFCNTITKEDSVCNSINLSQIHQCRAEARWFYSIYSEQTMAQASALVGSIQVCSK